MSSSMESCLLMEALLFGTETSGPKSTGCEDRKQRFAVGPLGEIVNDITPISTPWFLASWVLAIWEKAPGIGRWSTASTAFWRCLPQPCKILPPVWHCKWAFKRSFHCLSNQLPQDGGQHGKTSELHEDRPTAALPLLWHEFLDSINAGVEHHDSRLGILLSPQIVVLAEALCAVKVYSNKNKMSLPWWKQSSLISLPPGSGVNIRDSLLVSAVDRLSIQPWW